MTPRQGRDKNLLKFPVAVLNYFMLESNPRNHVASPWIPSSRSELGIHGKATWLNDDVANSWPTWITFSVATGVENLRNCLESNIPMGNACEYDGRTVVVISLARDGINTDAVAAHWKILLGVDGRLTAWRCHCPHQFYSWSGLICWSIEKFKGCIIEYIRPHVNFINMHVQRKG